MQAVYACINRGEAYVMKELEQQSILIDRDIGKALKKLQISE